MFIVMHCGGIPFNGDTIKTKSLGGSESAAYYVAKELAARGHSVTLFTNSTETGTFDGVKYEWAGTPSEDAPLGDRFTFYAENTPHDVLIIQRHPAAFHRKYASKMNFLWLHDLALYRTKDAIMGQMWNVNGVLCVSEHHRQQIHKVYDIPMEHIYVINNGVDLSLFDGCEPLPFANNELHMVYSSRPERGLRNLVDVGGIMERLHANRVPAHLHVCGYDNTTPQMADEYKYLWSRCEELENVSYHGALTKRELARLMVHCDVLVYPTEFEEVSCITAMEAMAAGCHVIASEYGALPETCAGAGTMIPLKDGHADHDAFIAAIVKAASSPLAEKVIAAAKRAAERTWHAVVDNLECVVDFQTGASRVSVMNHYMRHSDIAALASLHAQPDGSALMTKLLAEYNIAYRFYRENDYAEHYRKYYEYEARRGVAYGPEDVTRTSRFIAVAQNVAALPKGSFVLDYGCAHGHYTVALARMFPQLNFVGADITQSNIDAAGKWAADEGLSNTNFVKVGGVDDANELFNMNAFDLIIAAEVIEHVGDPQHYIDALASHLNANGVMVITVPYGPWEAQGYREHKFWRAHLHHFERQDLKEMLGHHPNYRIIAAPSGQSIFSSALGSYIVTFGKPVEASRPVDYLRKHRELVPDQTLSCCMIVKDAETDIKRCLNSIAPHVQEIIIGIDESSSDATRQIILDMARTEVMVAWRIIDLQPVAEVGFAAARNTTIAQASGDWILWIDADEVLVNGATLPRYLRKNIYNGYAIKQHHFSNDPAAVIKTDLPCRIFRNRIGVHFYGEVHEHPEQVMNEGLGAVSIMSAVSIVHYGYTDERVRRKRFDRNLPLLARDRKVNPSRLLGKFLWLRDLAQACQYDMEAGAWNPQIFEARIAEGLQLFEELLASKNLRIIVDSLPYYSQLTTLRGGGIEFSFALDASRLKETSLEGKQAVAGYFASTAHIKSLLDLSAETAIGDYDGRYL